MAIRLPAEAGRELIVLPVTGTLLYEGKAYHLPRIWGSNPWRRVAMSDADLQQAGTWPVISQTTMFNFQEDKVLCICFAGELSINNNRIRNFFITKIENSGLDRLAANVNAFYSRRFFPLRERERRLAVCMMSHGRLGKDCPLNHVPELVKMLIEYMPIV